MVTMNKTNIRSLSIDNVTENDSANKLVFSCASPAPYTREMDDLVYNEVLEISDSSIDFTRLVDQRSPLLFEHDMERQIGVVDKAWIENEKLYVAVRFSKSKFAQEILTDIKDDIRRNVSIGYIINDYQMIENKADIPTMLVKNFTIYEVSIVSTPADPFVGINRNLKIGLKTMENEELQPQEEIVETETKSEEVKEETQEIVEEKAEETITEETQEEVVEEPIKDEEITDEADEIRAAGELAGEEELAEECIKGKKSLEDFKNLVKSKRNINSNKNDKKDIQMKKYFSISKAIRNACSQYKGDVSKDFETQIIADNKRAFGIGEEYDIVVSRRALAPTATNGQELIAGEYLPQEFTPALRPATALSKTGYRLIPSTGHAVSFAVVTQGAKAQMYSLDGELADGDLKFANKELKPRKGGVCVPIPYSLLLQARPEIDAMVSDDVVKALDELKDEMALIGSGENNEPTGIAKTAGVNTMGVDEIFTWAGVCKAERLIRDSNDMTETLFWVMNSTNYNKFKTTLKDDVAGAEYLLEDGKINGYEAVINNALDDNTVILGNFDELVITPFDGIMLKVDDITFVKKGAVQVIATEAFDTLVRRPKSFTVTTA
jgi:HK97 family phage major capsid protein/HK97 family phage prohead protease